jgi:hypothetical protein
MRQAQNSVTARDSPAASLTPLKGVSLTHVRSLVVHRGATFAVATDKFSTIDGR